MFGTGITQTLNRLEGIIQRKPRYCTHSQCMGVGRIVSRGGPKEDFPKIFLGGAKSGKICFFPVETKENNLFAETFKIQGAKPPPHFRRSWTSGVTDGATEGHISPMAN